MATTGDAVSILTDVAQPIGLESDTSVTAHIVVGTIRRLGAIMISNDPWVPEFQSLYGDWLERRVSDRAFLARLIGPIEYTQAHDEYMTEDQVYLLGSLEWQDIQDAIEPDYGEHD